MSSFEVAQQIRDIANKYEAYSSMVILFIGIISNGFIIMVFTTQRIFRRNQCAYYLAVESFANISLLLSVLPSNIASYALNGNPTSDSVIWCKIQLMLLYSCGLYSLFTVCFLAFDQFLSTHHRQDWRQNSTLKLAHRLIFCNISLALVHGVIFLVFASNGILGCSIYNPILKMYFVFFYYPILNYAFPTIITVVFSLLAYRNVRRIVRRQIPLVRRQLDRQMTAIALTRIICLQVLGTPFVVFSLFEANIVYANDNYIGWAVLRLLSVILYSILYCNYSINFYLFLFISSHFRRQMKHCFMKKCWRRLIRLFTPRVPGRTNNQIAPEIVQQHVSIVESM